MLSGQRNFAKQSMRQRKIGIEFQSFPGFFLRDLRVLPTEQHARREKMSRRTVGRKTILLGEGMASILKAVAIDVAQGENVRRIRTRLCCPCVSPF